MTTRTRGGLYLLFVAALGVVIGATIATMLSAELSKMQSVFFTVAGMANACSILYLAFVIRAKGGHHE